MSPTPKVSILINNYNYGRFLGEAIDSALQQTYYNCEVIVVDDGSTDNSREIIASYGDRIITIFKENGGQASAFNAGFAASEGEIICFLDSDDLFMPDKTAEVVKSFQKYPESHWCFHPLDYTSDDEELIEGQALGEINQYDLRSQLRSGRIGVKLPPILPATSGMCFRRDFLSLMLPMPEGKGIALNDNFLKFSALPLSKGLTINRKLGVQRIHNNNAYTFTEDQDFTAAKLQIINAYWMRIKFPELANYTNKLFALGLGRYWRHQNLRIKANRSIEIEFKKVINDYFPLANFLEKQQIFLKAFFYYLRA